MTNMASINEFVERVKAAAQECGCVDNLPASRAANTGRPVVSWFNGISQEIHDLDKVLAQAQKDEASSRRAVCVLENINWEWIGVVGSAWKLEPSFFVEHGANPTGDDAWTTLFPQNREIDIKKGPSKHKYVDGVFEHHYLAGEDAALDKMNRGLANSAYRRRSWIPVSSYPPSSCTRMSYCRVNANLCMITYSLFTTRYANLRQTCSSSIRLSACSASTHIISAEGSCPACDTCVSRLP
jgi:hypothetical protein